MNPDEATPTAEPTEAPPAEMAAPDEVVDAALADPTAPTPDTPAEPAAEEADPTLDVMNSVFEPKAEDAPAWMQPLLAALEKDGKESFKVSADVFKEAPIEIQQVITNYRNMALRKSDETAREAQGLATLREQLRLRGIEQDERDARVYQVFQDPKLKEMVKPPEGAMPNYIEDPEGFVDWKVQSRNSEWGSKFLGTIGEVSEDFKAQAMAAVEEKRVADERPKLEAFVKDHPEMLDDAHRDEIHTVATALADRDGVPPGADHNIRAFNMVMLDKGLLTVPKVDRAEQARAAMRTNGASPTKPALPPTPEGLDGMALHEFYDANPGTMKRDADELERRGISF